MAEVLVRLYDGKYGVEMEVKFKDAIDNNSEAHQAVGKLADVLGLQKVVEGENATEPTDTTEQ